MKSIARHEFPLIVWREEEKLLWNPIHRKALKNRPEERVRLRIIEYLLAAEWSKHRISTEEAIKDYSASSLRTDIICYNQQFEPQILAECKAEHIPLTTRTAEQVARYNQQVQAPNLLISNGKQDLWYQIHTKQKEVTPLDTPPGLLPHPKDRPRDFNYWKKRGFAGSQASPELRRWLEPVLRLFISRKHQLLHYLQFKKSPTDIDLNHYYHITPFEEEKVALTFLNTPFGGSRAIAILNKDRQNKAVAEVNLDLVFEDEQPNTSIYSSAGIKNIDITNENVLGDMDHPLQSLEEVSGRLRELFVKYLGNR